MSGNPTIRPMAERDLPAVLAVQAACYAASIAESGGSLLSKLRASPSTCFVALVDGAVAGYLISLPWAFAAPPAHNLEVCRLPDRPDCLYLHDLAVAHVARKTGAGRALVESFLAGSRALGLARASLIAVQDSTRYWARHGFRVVPQDSALREKLSGYGPGVEYMQRMASAAPARPGR
ncbi:MAG: GNAT family N-acetyltransferase [Rhodocyclaceae bacterium]|nr:GNAT family N-acetyltransferase [Rhodocyclaceae bacterium]